MFLIELNTLRLNLVILVDDLVKGVEALRNKWDEHAKLDCSYSWAAYKKAYGVTIATDREMAANTVVRKLLKGIPYNIKDGDNLSPEERVLFQKLIAE
jgi:hypothetical protein